MVFKVIAIFEDGSSRIVEYTDNYEWAVHSLLAIADQRKIYLAPIPLLQSVQLIVGEQVEIEMAVQKCEFNHSQQAIYRAGVVSSGASLDSSYLRLEERRLKNGQTQSDELVFMSAFSRPVSALDMLARWVPSRMNDAGFHSGLDNPSHTVRVMGCGIWRENHAELYFDQQKRIVDEARRRFGTLSVLFDVRNWVVENAQSALQFQAVNAELYHPDDRLAAVVRSATDKEHPRIALRGDNTEVFTSRRAAETWLHASGSFG
jgi:hypothetical protein